MMQAHPLFPILVGEFSYDEPQGFKKIFFENVHKHINEDGEDGEFSGHIDIHHDLAFQDLFVTITEHAREYVRTLSVDPEQYTFNLVKAWFSALKEASIPQHDHSDAHLSFAYYVNVPDEAPSAEIRFVAPRPSYNDLHNGMFGQSFDGVYPVNEWNTFNSPTWGFTPTEGTLFIFPARLAHYTNNGIMNPIPDVKSANIDILKKKRICLAGDFVLTFANKSNRSMGIQPVSNWKVF